MTRFRSNIAMLGILALGSSAYAELPEGFVLPKPAGLGNATTATANDESSIWTNPAGVARVRKPRKRGKIHLLKFPNAIVGLNAAAGSFYNALKGASNDMTSAVSDADLSDDKPFYVRAGAFPVILFDAGKNQPMGFGIFSNSITKVSIEKESPTDAQVTSLNDVGAALNMSFTTFANRVTLGIQVRPTYRYAYEDTIPSTELLDKSALKKRFTKDSNSGTGIGADVGVIWTMADFWFPTVGLAIRNLPTGCQDDYLNTYTEKRQKICGTLYSGFEKQADATSSLDPMNMRAGIAISPRLFREFSMRLSADVHNIPLGSESAYYSIPGVDFAKMIHGGMEFFVGNPLEYPAFSARLGANQGFATFGLGINAGYLSLEFASYGVDISSKAERKEDRRYVAALSALF